MTLALWAAVALWAGPPGAAALEAGLPSWPAGPARAVRATALLRGAPYRASPLGEGERPDRDPRFRLDAFDCVTFVETAIALGNAGSVAEARALLDDVRYDGPPGFSHRNHYVEAQWLPANARKGWIEDVTGAVAGELMLRAELRHSQARWRAAARAGRLVPGLDPGKLPEGSFPLPYLPLDHLVELAPRIPEGTVLLLVRAERPARPLRVTHMGLVVAGAGGERLLRHASDVPGVLRVRDERLDRFARRTARERAWPAVGVSLWAIRDNGARAAMLRAGAAGGR